MTGHEALTMDEIAARISTAIGKPVKYVSIDPEIRRRELLTRALPEGFVDALDDQTKERLKHPIAKVLTATHEMFGVQPTHVADFAQRHATGWKSKGRPVASRHRPCRLDLRPARYRGK